MTVVFQVDSCWKMWGSFDQRKHRASNLGELAGCRIGIFFDRIAPMWAGWLRGSATSGHGIYAAVQWILSLTTESST